MRRSSVVFPCLESIVGGCCERGGGRRAWLWTASIAGNRVRGIRGSGGRLCRRRPCRSKLIPALSEGARKVSRKLLSCASSAGALGTEGEAIAAVGGAKQAGCAPNHGAT
jgi:hypothetical protein